MKKIDELLENIDEYYRFKILISCVDYFMSVEELKRTIDFYVYKAEKKLNCRNSRIKR